MSQMHHTPPTRSLGWALTVDDSTISQPNGGGVNSSATVDLSPVGGTLDAGESLNVAFVFKADRGGGYSFSYKAEADPPSIIAAASRSTRARATPAPARRTVVTRRKR